MLEKNLEALAKTNRALADIIRNTELTGKAQLFLGPQNEINMAYEDIALHRMRDPLGEAREVYEAGVAEDQRDHQATTCIFGLGLGYLFRRAYVSSQARIILYEPYLEVLRLTFENVDFSEELDSKRVFIITDIKEMTVALNWAYMRGDNFTTIALPAYHAKEPQFYLDLLNEIKSSLYLTLIGQNTALLKLEEFTGVSITNLPHVLRYPDAQIMHHQFKDMPAVIVSAGPSLDAPGVLETLKKYENNLIISCVGQAAKALDRAGIIPDLVSVVEASDVSHQIDGVSYMADMNLLLLPQSNPKLFAFSTKRKLIAHSNMDPVTQWLSQALQQSFFGYNHIGTVSVTALIHLMKMGCNPIYLLGQDLAFPEGKMYADNSVYHGRKLVKDQDGRWTHEWGENKEMFRGIFHDDTPANKIKEANWLASLTECKDWDGQGLLTTASYDGFRKAFEHIQHCHPDFKLINCSEGGAAIEGFEHLTFPEALEKYPVDQYRAKACMEDVLASYAETPEDAEAFQKTYDHYQVDRKKLMALAKSARNALKLVEKAQQALAESEKPENANNSELLIQLQDHITKLIEADHAVSEVSKNHQLINAFINKQLFKYRQNYGRRVEFTADQTEFEDDMGELKENLENTQLLFKAVTVGVKKLIAVMDPVFKKFPVDQPQPAFRKKKATVAPQKTLSAV